METHEHLDFSTMCGDFRICGTCVSNSSAPGRKRRVPTPFHTKCSHCERCFMCQSCSCGNGRCIRCPFWDTRIDPGITS